MSAEILFVEDDARLRDLLIEAASLEGFRVEGVSSAEAAITRLEEKSFDILLTDIQMPGISGLDLLTHCRRLRPATIMLVMTAYGTIDLAVEAMKRGAADFLTKPFTLDILSSTLRVAAERAEQHRARQETMAGTDRAVTASGEQTPAGSLSEAGIVFRSAAMRRVMEQARTIAPYNTTVLVTGETGTGKELIARAIHQASGRRRAAFIALNCAAVPEQLLEDELFGHVRGAYTGAHVARTGRFEQADGGTLFLDEIGDMSLALQAKLLRVLQEREFEKLGSTRTIKVDVRIIAATSADLERRIAEGSFRPDLYYRLNVVHIRVPPLRERPEEIRALGEHLLKRFCQSVGLEEKRVREEAWRVLERYHWPGNVRQLQNAMERAAALTGGKVEIGVEDLPEEVRGGAASGVSVILGGGSSREEREAIIGVAGKGSSEGEVEQEEPETLEGVGEGVNFEAVVTKVERELLLKSLRQTGGNKMRAAKLLGMKRTTFVEKLKRLQIDEESSAAGGEDA